MRSGAIGRRRSGPSVRAFGRNGPFATGPRGRAHRESYSSRGVTADFSVYGPSRPVETASSARASTLPSLDHVARALFFCGVAVATLALGLKTAWVLPVATTLFASGLAAS